MDAVRRKLAEENAKLGRRVEALERELGSRGPRPGRDEGQSSLLADAEAAQERIAVLEAALREERSKSAALESELEGAPDRLAHEEALERLAEVGAELEAALSELVGFKAAAAQEERGEKAPPLMAADIVVGPEGDTDPEAGE